MERPRFIGVCLSTIHEEDRYNFILEFNKHAVKNGYRLIVFNSCSDLYEQSKANNEGSSAVFKLLPYKKLAAVVIFPNIMYMPDLIDEVIAKCHENNVPVISIDKDIEGCISFHFAYSDIFERICTHVIEDHGARNVYMMAGFKNNIYSEDRIKAYRRTLEAHGMTFDTDKVGYGNFWEQPTIDQLNQWFIEEKRDIPDAIICANDFMAITTSSFLQNMGVRIPEDCIVTGFDGIKQAEYLPPNITTCKQDFDSMGRQIIDAINRLTTGETVEGPFYVDFNIVYNESCGCRKKEYSNVTNAIRSLIGSLRLSDERQKMITSSQDSIPKIVEFNYLPRMIMDKFRFNTCVFAVNENVFTPQNIGMSFKGGECFSDNMEIIFHRYDRKEYPQCRIPREMLIPRCDLFTDNEDPIIACCINFTDSVMGYCLFQPPIDVDEYDKMHSVMATIGSAMGVFYGRTQVKLINSQLRSANKELQRLSQHDYMTGLFNRRGFFDKLDDLLSSQEFQGHTLIFISADLDDLKYINDTFGHGEGDNAIITVGNALLSSSLQGEICARFGGDEFGVAVFIGNSDAKTFFEDFRQRFLKYLSDYNSTSGKPYEIKASIGYKSDIITGEMNTDELIKSADEMMYANKQACKRKR